MSSTRPPTQDVLAAAESLGHRLAYLTVHRPVVVAVCPGDVLLAEGVAAWLDAPLAALIDGAIARPAEIDRRHASIDGAPHESLDASPRPAAADAPAAPGEQEETRRVAGAPAAGGDPAFPSGLDDTAGRPIPPIAGRPAVIVACHIPDADTVVHACTGLRDADAATLVAATMCLTVEAGRHLAAVCDDVIWLRCVWRPHEHPRRAAFGERLIAMSTLYARTALDPPATRTPPPPAVSRRLPNTCPGHHERIDPGASA
jgi:predicted phosphoribosyltransferase